MKVDEKKIEKITQIGRAISNESRIKIMILCEHNEYSITDLKKLVGISYPNIHGHIKTLKQANLIETRTQLNEKGKNIIIKSLYRISDDFFLEKINNS
jgi:DNA-binding transcriptional ArsR family regulator